MNSLPLKTTPDIAAIIDGWRSRFEALLEQRMQPDHQSPGILHKAMRFSSLAGGKRIRPLLVYATGKALGTMPEALDATACAIEFMHSYSLIHDDLPAMDDDTLRRGQPTCHLAFDEATAILAGDALQALAFQILASDKHASPEIALRNVNELAIACGSTGMAGGQMLDLNAPIDLLDIRELEHIHALKTGALIQFSVRAPALISGASASTVAALDRYGYCVGLGFQICDDILNVTGDVDRMGKHVHTDAQRNMPTFPSLIGIDASRQRSTQLLHEALDSLKMLDGDTTGLAWLADSMISRDH